MAIIKGGSVTGSAVTVKTEIAVGTVNGVNDTFSTPTNYVPGSLLVFLNGLAQSPGASEDYIELTSPQFQFNSPPQVTGSYVDKILVYYQEAV